MKKKVIMRAFLGFPLGVFINQTIAIFISAGIGTYAPAAPQLIEQMGSETGAVVLQYVLSGILGAAYAGGSCVWEMQEWSILKQTLIHLLISSASMFPIAWFSWWMPHTLVGALGYAGLFMAIYVIIYIAAMFYWKKKIANMNSVFRGNQ